ncbi:hypothetical protein ACQKDA_09695 [Psychrobacter sp. NPDC078370]|uniref:hypothetical protein n=1 Tax=Psychrobacter TaxID=497 RepID=UPI000C7F0A3F|nr:MULTISPECIES: hypothetical protein [Psychrobacter]PLT21462.1 hypothetical protein CXF62_10025 [Psychrobacter sp. MES7-P7E]|tara:strand:- start:5670 stop:6815 length:1146 start_codon:yes stop_codon:yes gene_type:complete
MKNNIGNSEGVMLKNLVKTKVVISLSLGALLLPLSAIAETNELPTETYAENITDSSKSKVNELTNENLSLKKGELSNSATSDPVMTDLNSNSNESTQNNDTATTSVPTQEPSEDAKPNDGNNAASTTKALDSVNELDSANTEEKAIEQQPEIAKEMPFWQNTDYLLIGGLALLLLGGGLLLFRKISSLNAENRNLNQKQKMLSSNLAGTKKELAQAKIKNAELEANLNQQLAMHTEVDDSTSVALGAVLPVIDELMVEPDIEDLNAADLQQLSDSITTWFKTNRGNTEVRELVPNDIQHKLDHLSYKIELWVGSDGVDSVELASNTMRAAVISLTKPDRQGFAYCYKKPNSLSAVWVNKAWYQAQRTERSLEVIGKPLESN